MDSKVKIRSITDLIDFLGNRKQLRKRELISLYQDLSKPTIRVCRAAIVLSYAHWEGFVKEAARAYVCLVSHKSRSLDSLAINFQALVCRQELLAAQNAKKRIQPHISLTMLFTDNLKKSCSIDPESVIDTESNLSAEVFANICLCIGIDYHKDWSTYGPFMDDLLKIRCEVAHGNLIPQDEEYAKEILNFCINAIDRFSNDIENAASQSMYLRNKEQSDTIFFSATNPEKA